ncbi:hypothetical protein NHX12_020901 [Muraenolepis orangiensis]|uniref:GDP/GTP exchange factor Sec2 N-terminal domain-containing protein n=1 Tax=Muraenolepis orangiensis TaxID=630683 RepID=A0A9Q0ESU3_9TELE|nr:hypothetical protein NHX12_020901 [Muraenolepis orangiensis]
MANSSSSQTHAEPLEGFHEVNLASPTTPDLQNQAEQRALSRHSAPPSSLYRTSSLGAPPGGLHTTLRADQLPTQPVYSAPRLSHNGSVPGMEAEPGDGNFLSGEEGEECSALSDSMARLRSPSVMEAREKSSERMKEDLIKAQREAHKMVREANIKQATAEKQLTEALGKIDVLQAEVSALKTLVLSSPTSPVGELPGGGGAAKTTFRKGHGRHKSTSSAMQGSQPEASATQPIVRDGREVDGQLFGEFKAWREDPTMDRSCSFMERLGSAILEAVEQNTLSVEPVGFQPLPVVKASAMECGGPNYYYVSPYCRYRITSVCNFFTYIRYIQQGLLRREMSLAKLGYYKDQL